MQIEIIKENNNVFYKIPYLELEEYRLKKFISPNNFAKKIGIPVRNYYNLIRNGKKGKKVHTATAMKINNFIKTINGGR